jgi:hypothetical protein
VVICGTDGAQVVDVLYVVGGIARPAVEGCWDVVAGMLGTSVCDETGRLGRGRWGIGPGM